MTESSGSESRGGRGPAPRHAVAPPPAWNPVALDPSDPARSAEPGAPADGPSAPRAPAAPATPAAPTNGVTAVPAVRSLTRAEVRARRQEDRRSWRRRRVPIIVLVVVVLLGAAGVGAARLASYSSRSTIDVRLATFRTATEPPPPLPWPSAGEAAVSVPAIGWSASSANQSQVPVASLTKIMTAYVLLKDHPLPDGQDGPDVSFSIADAVEFLGDLATDQANVQVQAGEVLSERQVLEGMLIRSGNNLATTMAVWDAGSLDAFVAKMNATAAALGLQHTHFVDASGIGTDSASTPADLLALTAAAMTIPAFAQIVSMPSVTLPVAGTLESFTPLLDGSDGGVKGVVGVKSGYTSAAGGSDVMAYRTTIGGEPLTILAAVTGQPGSDALSAAGQAALKLAQAVADHLRPVQVAAPGRSVGRASVRGSSVPVVDSAGATFLVWPGEQIHQSVVITRRPVAGSPAETVGRAMFWLGPQRATVALRTARDLPSPSLVQRLL